MRRRDFITLVGGAAGWPLAANAQQSAMPVVGFLSHNVPDASAHLVAAFRKGLSETGYVEGRNAAIEFRWASNQLDRLPELAEDLVQRRVAVIATPLSTPASLAAKAASKTIPIVFGVGTDPVKIGLVASLNRPGGNVTGIASMNRELGGKLVGLLHELLPTAARIGVLINPKEGSDAVGPFVSDTEAAATSVGKGIEILAASRPRDIDAVFAALIEKRLHALLVSAQILFLSRRAQIVGLTLRHAVFITAGEKTLPLFPVPNTAVIEALLGQVGLKAEPSPGGRLADRLLEKLDGLEGARVFKIRGVRQLVANLTSQDAVGRGDATNAIWNGGQFREHERLYIEPRDAERLGTDATFDFLLKNEFFRAGLELKCDNCGLTSWLSLRQIDDGWICEYCGHRNMTSLHIRDRGDWRFRKSGLLAKDNNQEGAIPVLLSLLVLQRVLQREGVLRMTSVNMIEGVPPCEIDFMVVEHHSGEINWGLGEAKGAGGEIDAKDVGNMKSVADKLKKIGAHTYLIFAKTAESFTQKEIELFAATRKEGYPVILFTNKEIEPYDPYYHGDEQEGLPHRYVHSFDEMVRNSEFRYLRPKAAAGDTTSTGA